MTPDIKDAMQWFTTPQGKAVLRHLEQIANGAKIDRDNPILEAALYRCAQLDLIRHIKKSIGILNEE